MRTKNASRPNLQDPTFLIHNKATKGPPVTKEREKVAEVLKELDHMVTELPKYAIIKLVDCDETTFNKMQLTQTLKRSNKAHCKTGGQPHLSTEAS